VVKVLAITNAERIKPCVTLGRQGWLPSAGHRFQHSSAQTLKKGARELAAITPSSADPAPDCTRRCSLVVALVIDPIRWSEPGPVIEKSFLGARVRPDRLDKGLHCPLEVNEDDLWANKKPIIFCCVQLSLVCVKIRFQLLNPDTNTLMRVKI
jgi:hypothetical protein